MRIARAGLLLAVVVTLAGPMPRAWACLCVQASDAAYSARVDVVFEGVVTGRTSVATGAAPFAARWHIDTDRAVKGSVSDPQDVDVVGGDCGPGYGLGKRYRIFASRSGSALVIDGCSGTRAITAAGFTLAGGAIAAVGGTVAALAIGLVVLARMRRPGSAMPPVDESS